MMRGTIRQTIGAAALAALLPLLCVSCSSEDDISTASVGGGDNGTVTMGVTFRVSEGYYLEGYYEPGTEYENYIDIKVRDYKIYFFEASDANGNDKLITEFTPESLLAVDGSNYTEYSMLGEVPDALIANGETVSFKIVMLANWGSYPTTEDGVTTIDNICNAATATFDAFVADETALIPEAGRLIPFYGVNTYENITFKANDATILTDPVNLLRAMAKVEVIFEDDDYQYFDAVKLHRYNAKGYCAPDKVYKQSDYADSSDEWATGIAQEDHIHLVGNSNDTDDKSFNFLQTEAYSKDDATYETWTAYVPEYDNTGDDYSSIEVVLRGISYNIYFANYTDGNTDNTDSTKRYDIFRNNLYRFTVSMGEQTLNVHVNKWDNVYENEFDFVDE